MIVLCIRQASTIQLIKIMLEREGMTVLHSTQQPLKAAAIVAEHKPKLLVSDSPGVCAYASWLGVPAILLEDRTSRNDLPPMVERMALPILPSALLRKSREAIGYHVAEPADA